MVATDREANPGSASDWDSDLVRQHVRIVQGGGGPKACIVGSRIRVVDVMFWYEHDELHLAEIVDRFPQLSEADIHAALAYYWDNQGLFDREIADTDAYVDVMRRTQPSVLRDSLKRYLDPGASVGADSGQETVTPVFPAPPFPMRTDPGEFRAHIRIADGDGTSATVGDGQTRVTDIAVAHERLGITTEELLTEYPDLTRGDVHAALAFYWDHRAAFERRIEQDDAYGHALRHGGAARLLERLGS